MIPSLQHRLHTLGVRFSSKSPVLVNTDIDHSLISWTNLHDHEHDEAHLTHAADTLQQFPNDQTHIMATTARSPSLLGLCKSIIGHIPFRHLSTNNGQGLFQQPSHPSSTWELTLPDPRYQQLLTQQYHWSPKVFKDLLGQTVSDMGFTPLPRKDVPFAHKACWQVDLDTYQLTKPSGDRVILMTVADQASVYWWPMAKGKTEGKPDAVDRQLNQQLARTVSAALTRHGIRHHTHSSAYPDGLMLDFAPDGVDKRFVTDYMVKTLPEPPRAVITVDDNTNGKPMLEVPHYTWREGAIVPNFPIVVGSKLTELDSHPRILRAQRGELGLRLRQQFEKALS